MPEYLAPGVYVEEVDTGAKPIEGVSTSTCGVVGVTERGPANVPVLVTSVGDYVHWFGGRLSAELYDVHRYLPHAIEGFFTNGGKRVYVVRALDESATKAKGALFDRGGESPTSTTLLRAVGEGAGSAASPLVLLEAPAPGLKKDDWVRIGGGSTAEYRELADDPDADDLTVVLDLPLARSHPGVGQVGAEKAYDMPRTVDKTFKLVGPVAPGASGVIVKGTKTNVDGLAGADLSKGEVVIEIGVVGEDAEYRLVREATDVAKLPSGEWSVQVRLDVPLFASHQDDKAVTRITVNETTSANIMAAASGASAVFVDTKGAKFTTAANLVQIGTGLNREVRALSKLSRLTIATPLDDGAAVTTRAEIVKPGADRKLAVNATTNTLTVLKGEGNGLVRGQRVVIDQGGTAQTVTIDKVNGDILTVVGLDPAKAPASKTVIPEAKLTTAKADVGSRTLALNDRMGIAIGSLLAIGSSASAQIVVVTALPGQTDQPPDSGNVVVTPPLASIVNPTTAIAILRPVARRTDRPPMALVLPASAGGSDVVVGSGVAFAAAELLRLTAPSGEVSYHRVSNSNVTAVKNVIVNTPLKRSHPAGSDVTTRDPLLDLEALDAGEWGNRLQVSVTDSNPGLVGRTEIKTIINPTTIRLKSRSGVQPGSILEISDAASGAVIGEPVKVSKVDRTTGNITFAGAGLALPQQVIGASVRSREFNLTVLLLRQPDPAVPSRDGQIIDQEEFRHLSLDPRHSNYIETIIGRTNGPERKWDKRPEGSSLYIRVLDKATDADKLELRLGPEPLVDTLPDGRRIPARRALEDVRGDDAINLVDHDTYLGSDNIDPEERTGLQALRNIEEVSLVAIPGGVEPAVQQGLIDHCELMRYRFAVLDSMSEPKDTIPDTQDQRQQFDSKYAALYYPWLSIPDPFPTNPADVRDYAIPPSGHMLGVYARTDIDRGVHKAPANELVRGITGLRRKINKEQQDILNPYPVNINVIRDFRDNNRGIRVYGGRVITSDPDWKYVNVRRLLIFIEASIDRGLQWVVFEPNSEPLWARVQRTIGNFLTVVWRNGALEGTSVEEAFFVRCDRTTMTQTDIDNGRLIVQIGVAPVKPAEFVIVRIGLWTARSDS